jgi:hypothetical protein
MYFVLNYAYSITQLLHGSYFSLLFRSPSTFSLLGTEHLTKGKVTKLKIHVCYKQCYTEVLGHLKILIKIYVMQSLSNFKHHTDLYVLIKTSTFILHNSSNTRQRITPGFQSASVVEKASLFITHADFEIPVAVNPMSSV